MDATLVGGLTPGLARRGVPAGSAAPALATEPGCFGAIAVEGLFSPNEAAPVPGVFAVGAANLDDTDCLTDDVRDLPIIEPNLDSTLAGAFSPGLLGVTGLAPPPVVLLIAVDGLVGTLEEVGASYWLYIYLTKVLISAISELTFSILALT